MCDTKDVEVVRSLGSRDVLDRFREDFTANGEAYDVIFDAVGKHSFRRCRRSLKPGGIYISMDVGFLYHLVPLGVITKFVGSRRARLGFGRYRKEDLLLVKARRDRQVSTRVIDRRYTLDEVVEANRYVERTEDWQCRTPRERSGGSGVTSSPRTRSTDTTAITR